MDAPLDKEYVMNEFWKQSINKPQIMKDYYFENYALSPDYTQTTYSIQRYNIMAIVIAGANLKTSSDEHPWPALNIAVLNNDFSLVNKLIEYGADVNYAVVGGQ